MKRRTFLAVAAGGVGALGAATSIAGLPRPARAASPRRGGTLTFRGWDPPLFDPMLTTAYRVQIPLSFTHSRLLRHRAGPGVAPGTFPIEGDLAESWTQPNETTYVFKLRRGVRWHPKPPVNGRELTAEDVRYTVERFLTVKGNPSAYMLKPVGRVEAVDRYTVRFTLTEPFAWSLDMLASPMFTAIVAKECVDTFGDLKKAESVVGTGPWMLEGYRPNRGLSFVRHPGYFLPGLPHIDRVEAVVEEDNASRMAAFLAGRYDLGWEFGGIIPRADWLQIKEALRARRPRLRTAEFPSNVEYHVSMRADRPPFNDPRVRQALSLAVDRPGIVDAIFEGAAALNPAVPAAFKEWSLPIDRLGDGARYFRHDPAEARRLLAAAGYPNGFPAALCYATYGSQIITDMAQLVATGLREACVDVKLDQREYGAFIATCYFGNFDTLAYGPQTPYTDPHSYVYSMHFPGEQKNQSHVDHPVATDLLVRQQRTFDPAKRRDLLHALQRHLARQQYYLQPPSQIAIAAWDDALKNYGPNLGYDYGGRLLTAWLER